jgi:hypothetical protein
MVIPPEVLQSLMIAIRSGRWCFCCWYIEDKRLELRRIALNFPPEDHAECLRLIKAEFDKMK